jgi:hypothetical protein
MITPITSALRELTVAGRIWKGKGGWYLALDVSHTDGYSERSEVHMGPYPKRAAAVAEMCAAITKAGKWPLNSRSPCSWCCGSLSDHEHECPATPKAFPRLCTSCQRSITATQWAALPVAGPAHLGGRQEVSADPSDAVRPESYVLILRTCQCGTTMGMPEADDTDANREMRESEGQAFRDLREKLSRKP